MSSIVTPVLPPVQKGAPITASLKDGGQLPCWLTIDPLTGAIKGRPSRADQVQNTPVVVFERVPQPDGTVRTVTVEVKPNQFGQTGSRCTIVRTTPQQRGGGSPR